MNLVKFSYFNSKVQHPECIYYSSDNLFGHSKYAGIDPALTQNYESCVIKFVELSAAETAIIVIVVIISLTLITAGAFYVAKKYKDSRVS